MYIIVQWAVIPCIFNVTKNCENRRFQSNKSTVFGLKGKDIRIANHTKTLMSFFLVFNTLYRLETQSVMLVFSTPLVN
jgi:hypothetical protein